MLRSSACLLLIAAAPLAAQTARAPARPAASAAPAVQPIQRSDFIKSMDAQFDAMDANHDGIVTREEVERYQAAKALEAERQQRIALFRALDRNHDGMLTLDEFMSAPMPPPHTDPQSVMGFNSRRDGRLTKIEYRAGTLANFDRMDTDKDGVVSAAEMRAAGIIK